MLFNENLIDELQIFLMPIILQDGINLFQNSSKRTDLKKIETVSHENSAVEIKYEVLI